MLGTPFARKNSSAAIRTLWWAGLLKPEPTRFHTVRAAPNRAKPPAGSTASASARAKPSGSDCANGRNGAWSSPHTSEASMSVPTGSNSKRPNRSIRDTTSPGSSGARGLLGNNAMVFSWHKSRNRSVRAHRNWAQPV